MAIPSLEAILKTARQISAARGISPQTFEEILREAVRIYESDINKLYNCLKANKGATGAFEVSSAFNVVSSFSEMDECIRRTGIVLYSFDKFAVQKYMGLSYLDNNIAYVILEKTSTESVLWCYGLTFTEGEHARYSHAYFAVIGEYEKLRKVLDSFGDDPNNIRKFMSIVFNWPNRPLDEYWKCGGKVDLFATMKQMKLLDTSDGKGVQTYTAEKA
ncbi:hypothetical protein HY636_02925 [Candidatus Woesearchaeota archaeon]|nr:hypothetical protein [Candidatus Woesearchaeota archaeon]